MMGEAQNRHVCFEQKEALSSIPNVEWLFVFIFRIKYIKNSIAAVVMFSRTLVGNQFTSVEVGL
jgi:hypothetical protein